LTRLLHAILFWYCWKEYFRRCYQSVSSYLLQLISISSCMQLMLQLCRVNETSCLFAVCIAECERWKRTDNIHAENGDFYPLTSIAACMDLCLSKSSCVAVDMWSDTCALHLNASNLESNRVTNGVSQFVLDRSCDVSTVSTTLLETTMSTPMSGAMHLYILYTSKREVCVCSCCRHRETELSIT